MCNLLVLLHYSRKVECPNCGKSDRMIACSRYYHDNPHAPNTFLDYIWCDYRLYKCTRCHIKWDWEQFKIYGCSPATRVRKEGDCNNGWINLK